MPVIVKVVPGEPYGKTPRFCLRIESGYRAGQLMEASGVDSPMHWPSREDAEQWARDTGYTVSQAEPTASSKPLINLFETFSDFQFEDREISGAELVDDLGRWLRAHKAEVAGMPVANTDPCAAQLKDLFRLCRALHAGDSDVNGGDLVDTFGEWLRETQEEMSEIIGGPFVAKVVRSPDGETYWSERFGWGELDDATAYFQSVPAGLTSDLNAQWVEVELAASQAQDNERPRA